MQATSVELRGFVVQPPVPSFNNDDLDVEGYSASTLSSAIAAAPTHAPTLFFTPLSTVLVQSYNSSLEEESTDIFSGIMKTNSAGCPTLFQGVVMIPYAGAVMDILIFMIFQLAVAYCWYRFRRAWCSPSTSAEQVVVSHQHEEVKDGVFLADNSITISKGISVDAPSENALGLENQFSVSFDQSLTILAWFQATLGLMTIIIAGKRYF